MAVDPLLTQLLGGLGGQQTVGASPTVPGPQAPQKVGVLQTILGALSSGALGAIGKDVNFVQQAVDRARRQTNIQDQRALIQQNVQRQAQERKEDLATRERERASDREFDEEGRELRRQEIEAGNLRAIEAREAADARAKLDRESREKIAGMRASGNSDQVVLDEQRKSELMGNLQGVMQDIPGALQNFGGDAEKLRQFFRSQLVSSGVDDVGAKQATLFWNEFIEPELRQLELKDQPLPGQPTRGPSPVERLSGVAGKIGGSIGGLAGQILGGLNDPEPQ